MRVASAAAASSFSSPLRNALLVAVLQVLLMSYSATAQCDFRSSHPRRYAVYHLQAQASSKNGGGSTGTKASKEAFAAPAAITIDGLLNETAWEETLWSEDFVDIQGPQHWSQPWFATKVKMRYDDQFLYIGAYLEERAVWANVTTRNDVVFADNDFEVFVDADGSTHNYKEFEVNALNTTWNLLLNRPYRNGGHENSTRVDPENGFDMFGNGMKSAVFMKGTPNDPAQQMHFWTAEIALPLKELARYTAAVLPPKPMSFWRINFSRVEWAVMVQNNRYMKIPGQAEENWVWSPQHAVNMHMPENWGYIQFRPDFNERHPVLLDPEWNVRYLAFQLYYAQHAFKQANGYFSVLMPALEAYFPSKKTFACIDSLDLRVNNTAGTFEALVMRHNMPSYAASIRDDSFIQVRLVRPEIESAE